MHFSFLIRILLTFCGPPIPPEFKVKHFSSWEKCERTELPHVSKKLEIMKQTKEAKTLSPHSSDSP